MRIVQYGTLDEDTALPPTEGVSSLKGCAFIGEDLTSPWLKVGDAHRGRVRIYTFAISTGEPTSSSTTCNQSDQFSNATNNIILVQRSSKDSILILSFLFQIKTTNSYKIIEIELFITLPIWQSKSINAKIVTIFLPSINIIKFDITYKITRLSFLSQNKLKKLSAITTHLKSVYTTSLVLSAFYPFSPEDQSTWIDRLQYQW